MRWWRAPAAIRKCIPKATTGTIPRRSPRMTHLCSDRVTQQKRRTLIRKPQVGKALSYPPKAGRWVRFREQTRVITRECRRRSLAAEGDRSLGRGCAPVCGVRERGSSQEGRTRPRSRGGVAARRVGQGRQVAGGQQRVSQVPARGRQTVRRGRGQDQGGGALRRQMGADDEHGSTGA